MLDGLKGEDNIAELCRRGCRSRIHWSVLQLDVHRTKVANLTEALNDPETKAEAIGLIRSLLEEIRPIPCADGPMGIELVGELVGLLALAKKNGLEVFCIRLFFIVGCGSRI